ncbi:ankyrin repeat and SOCS box protein 3-like [Crassostrea angulata]|uniref:ankyrin repeat and SOCS box protein 3-like n=1 Tax=Magallana angulata TaxID=2784310 RepID=UPI0022B14171|nr:ankyrin repeat and SOCS box protein 3-like [Crassostrea angulata]
MQTTTTIQTKMENSAVSVDQVMLRVVESGDTKTLLKLVNCGKTSNTSDINGDPLLFIPIVNGNIEMLDTLLTYGDCDLELSNFEERTALMLAVEMDDIRMVRHLIKAGANVNATDNLGKTPLLLALEDGKFEIAEYLIKHGSDVNSVDDLGQSALLHITRGERRDCARIIRILLQCDYKIKEKIDEISREEIVTYQKQQERKIPTLVRKISLKMKRLPSFRQSIRITKYS